MKQSRNNKCNCGSGMKFKKCCMNLTNNDQPEFDIDMLIKKNNQNDRKSKSIGKRVGVLCMFHDSEIGLSLGSQRIIYDESLIKTDSRLSKDDFIGLINHLIRTEDVVNSKNISKSVLGYLPYTQTWKQSHLIYGNGERGFILNFYLHPYGISCEDCYTMSYEEWVDVSKEEQYKQYNTKVLLK